MSRPAGPKRLAKERAASLPAPPPPGRIDPVAREVWEEVLRQPNSITAADFAILETYCTTVSAWRLLAVLINRPDCEKHTMDAYLKLSGLIEKLGKRLLLDPVVRAARRSPAPENVDDLDDLLEESDDSPIPSTGGYQ